MPDRSRDWLRQAESDLESARNSHEAGKYDWAAFASHQAAEKAVKALHLSRMQDVWGPVVSELLQDLPQEVAAPEDLLERARVLDGHYVLSRYPNGYPEGAPTDHYGKLQSEQAVRYADQIVQFARSQMA
jgi:HEPN domain-containing protein